MINALCRSNKAFKKNQKKQEKPKKARGKTMLNKDEVEFYQNDIKECIENENGFYKLANKKLCEELYSHFKNEFPKMKKWELPFSQVLTFGVDGEKKLSEILEQLISEKETQLQIMKKMLTELT